ncbi:leucine-rich repeat-containing protein 15-like [Lutzomyia longipalpis]|uniref:leucine-rich repeat-containing protein 15-like n=1 Tax=Lutzomyia longipalpis TaxID=7200 RepID=UPI0024840CF1|nr:leucine-rich repeat-containing protein 15-like [Lutzomyia longipalpis]
MSYTKILLQVLLFLSIFVLKCRCNSCKEEYEFSVKCNSFEDLFKYPNPEKQESIRVTIDSEDEAKKREMEPFICDEPFFQKFTSVTNMDLVNVRVLHISSDCFEGMDAVRAIDLQANALTSIEMESFRTSDEMQLRAIFLNNNHIIKIDFTGVILPELTQFEAYTNRLKLVKLKNENLPKITNMYLGYNQITKFQIESNSMEKLDLSYNRIKSFKGSNLVLPNLNLIYLNDNSIGTMTPDMLENMPNLEFIYLAHNLLKTVSFPTLKQTNYVDLRYNRFRGIDSIYLKTLGKNYDLLLDSNKIFGLENPEDERQFENLTSITCHACFINIIEPFFIAEAFKNLKHLTLPSNALRTANIFRTHGEDLKLTGIDLSFNKIRKIGRKDFMRIPAVMHISLHNNEISNIAPGAFDTLQKLESLSLQNNLLFQLALNLFEKTTSINVLVLSGNNMPFFSIPGLQEATGKIVSSNSTLNKLNTLNIQKNPLQCQCVDLIRSWAKMNGIYLRIDDKEVRNGVKPACIVNDQGCKSNVGKEYIKDYWHLFNDVKLNNIFESQDEDEDK